MGDILQYFESELDYIRRAFEDFELAFPQKAKELGITAGHSSDPDLQRLADTLALEAARLNCRMDDTIPEIALDLMRMISPEFLLGAPSYAVIKPEWGVSSPIDPLRVPKNTPAPIALNSRGDYCKFSVARETILRWSAEGGGCLPQPI